MRPETLSVALQTLIRNWQGTVVRYTFHSRPRTMAHGTEKRREEHVTARKSKRPRKDSAPPKVVDKSPPMTIIPILRTRISEKA